MNDVKKKVLIIEDDTALRTVMSDAFIRGGFDVSTAENGKEGFDSAINIHPDLIILDVEMPVMNGLEALKNIRMDEWGKNANILILTNSASPGTMLEAVNLGVVQYMEKASIGIQDLVNEISDSLNGHSSSIPRVIKGSLDAAPTLETQHKVG